MTDLSDPPDLAHEHVFLGDAHDRNARRMGWVVGGSVAAMAIEVAAGLALHSMALLGDGLHMASHAGVFLAAMLAYRFARAHARDPRFSFGTGKLGDLAGFGSAIVLAVVALLIGVESATRLLHPEPIAVNEAIGVAVFGLVVSVASAWLLHDGEAGHIGHGHSAHGAHDLNHRAAYVHLVSDVFVSVLAVIGLLGVKVLGWRGLDAAAGLLGAIVVARFAWTLVRDAGAHLLDMQPDGNLLDAIRTRLEAGGDRVSDLHVWRLGPGHDAVIVSLASRDPQPPGVYRERLAELGRFSHVTVEVHPVGQAALAPPASVKLTPTAA